MHLFQIQIKNRSYTEWSYTNININTDADADADDVNKDNLQKFNNNRNPAELKLFNNDIVDENGELIESIYRSDKIQIPGILVLDGKTCGRDIKTNKMLYKMYS